MANEKELVCMRIPVVQADQLRLIAKAYTRTGEDVNLSVVLREAIRQFLAGYGKDA